MISVSSVREAFEFRSGEEKGSGFLVHLIVQVEIDGIISDHLGALSVEIGGGFFFFLNFFSVASGGVLGRRFAVAFVSWKICRVVGGCFLKERRMRIKG